MQLRSLVSAAAVAAALSIAFVVPAAASPNVAQPQGMHVTSLTDCGIIGSTPSVSGGVVSFSVFVYCDTIVDFLQADVDVTNASGAVLGSASCMDSSTSEFTCTATAACNGGGYYGGFADVNETNADDFQSEGTWTQPPVWLGC